MVKKSTAHPYADLLAFERLMLLITTLVRYPGIGCPESGESDDSLHQTSHDLATSNGKETSELPKRHHDALQAVRSRLQAVAQVQDVQFPLDYPAVPTLRKDLETLRRYGILDQRMYRWGYYLGTGVMTPEELQIAFSALASQAKDQGDPQVRQIYATLSQRLRGLDLELNGELFYPVRQQLNRPVGHTDPQEMMASGTNQDTLFHQLEQVEQAIIQGQAIELSCSASPYSKTHVGLIQIYPLQLVYYDVAWYLIYEFCSNEHLAIGRVDRFKNYCKVLHPAGRGIHIQKKRLQSAHKLLEAGWGLFLGEPEEQQAELQGRLKLETVKVRFFPPVITFILEGDRRHNRQTIRKGPKDSTTGQPTYVDYTVKLPPRSIDEFSRWVYRFMNHAKVLNPSSLVEKHKEAAQQLGKLYE
ncbi:WYL domain-containing protein [filamentous cyanobacterium CCP2]|nr:WYL domain-containing protein [filamentous cyanobacterium CCP2]